MAKFEREVEINAPVDKVWKVLTDPGQWPEWFPGIEGELNVTSISEGKNFEWAAEDLKGSGVVVKMQPEKRLEIETQIENDKDAHVFTLQPIGKFFGLGGNKSKVEYRLNTLEGGGILGRFIASGNPRDTMRVKKTMDLLRDLVEQR